MELPATFKNKPLLPFLVPRIDYILPICSSALCLGLSGHNIHFMETYKKVEFSNSNNCQNSKMVYLLEIAVNAFKVLMRLSQNWRKKSDFTNSNK